MDGDRAVAHLAERQHGLVTRPQAARCGLTSSGINRRLNLGSFVALHPGVYRLAERCGGRSRRAPAEACPSVKVCEGFKGGCIFLRQADIFAPTPPTAPRDRLR